MMIDYFLKFPDRATALADVTASKYARANGGPAIKRWLFDRVVEVEVWRASQDTQEIVNGPDGEPVSVTVHHPLPGLYVLISLPRVVPALRDHAAVQLVIDRDKMNARQPGMVIRRAAGMTLAVLQDIRIQPTFLGMDVPWGALD